MTKEERKEYNKKYYQENKEKIAEHQKQYRIENKGKFLGYWKHYYIENKDKILDNDNNNQLRKASKLLCAYNQSDKEHNRGKGDLTPEWIVDNIYTKKCSHCDETDWHKLGCNRLDNSKPHTMDNVEPCCGKCNKKLPRK